MKAISLLLAVLLQAPSPATIGKAYKFEKIAEGVYYATATGTMVTGSNNVAIIGDRDVLVVDTGTTPAAARAFIEDLKAKNRFPQIQGPGADLRALRRLYQWMDDKKK